MNVREEEPADIPHVHALNCSAFESPTEARIVDALRGQPDIISLVAEEDGTIVGHSMFSPVRLTGAGEVRAIGAGADGGGARAAACRHRVSPGARRAVRCREQGVEALFVVGHPEYYPRFGFSRASGFGFTCEFDVPDEVFMALELAPGALRGRTGQVFFNEAFRAT